MFAGRRDLYGHLTRMIIQYTFRLILRNELIVKWLISFRNSESIVKFNYSQMAMRIFSLAGGLGLSSSIWDVFFILGSWIVYLVVHFRFGWWSWIVLKYIGGVLYFGVKGLPSSTSLTCVELCGDSALLCRYGSPSVCSCSSARFHTSMHAIRCELYALYCDLATCVYLYL